MLRNALRTLVLAAVAVLSLAAKPVLADEPVECKLQDDPTYQGMSIDGITQDKVGKKECFNYSAVGRESWAPGTVKGSWPYEHKFQHYGPTQAEADQRVLYGMCESRQREEDDKKTDKKTFLKVYRRDDKTLICKNK